MSPTLRVTFPNCRLLERRQFRVVYEDGRAVFLWAEDSPAALTAAQQDGTVRSITGD